METRQPTTRTIPPIESKEQWDALVETIETEGDAIVENERGEKVAVISYDEFLEYQQQRRARLREESFARLRELEERQSRRNADLSEEEVERLALEAGREIRESLNEKYRTGRIGLPESDRE